MFFRILKKDLKRKRTMNIILLLFILLATMFLSSSVDNLTAVNGAIDHFMALSKVPDFFAIALRGGATDEISDFLEGSASVSEYEAISGFMLLNEDISITACQSDSGNTRYERTNTLFIQAVPENYMKIFDMDGGAVSLRSGEIAFSKMEAENNRLQVGDTISIQVGEVTQEFTIAVIVKDAVFGSPMMGFKRLAVSQEDFEKYENQPETVYAKIYNVSYSDEAAFKKEWREQNFSVLSTMNGPSGIRMCYIMDMLIAAILIVVSICLILIAFLVLRFTIVFTLQEDFKEIGIMKAIGIRDSGIKGLYLTKYLALSIAGGAGGLALSFPFGRLLLEKAVVNIVVDRADQNLLINIVCAAAVILIVLSFCLLSTNRLKKISAMEAIRSGSTGERYKATHRFKLRRRPRMKPYLYMAVNDILSSLRRFGILFVTFCIGTMLILLPLSAASTLKDDNIIREFSISPSDAYMDTGRGELYTSDYELLLQDMAEIEETLAANGLRADVSADMGYMLPCYTDNPEESISFFTLQAVGNSACSYSVLSGREPALANELMLTEITAKELGVGIGDTVRFATSHGAEEFIVTGTYQSMINMGQGCRVSKSADMDAAYMAGLFCLQVEIADMDSAAACERLAEIFPDYRVMNAAGFLDSMLGSVISQLDTLMASIVGIVLVINSLITILMMKTIMTEEHGTIALLKSIGFLDTALRAWQIARVLLVLVSAILAGTLLSNLLAPVLVGPIFAIMGGTSIDLVTGTMEACLLYPLLLLAVTGASAALCTGGIRRVDVQEVNRME
ncbi:MAG: ABC transporter permease [Roseburia sp.]|nr:ABC transporter permease [Roseburia sp.]